MAPTLCPSTSIVVRNTFLHASSSDEGAEQEQQVALTRSKTAPGSSAWRRVSSDKEAGHIHFGQVIEEVVSDTRSAGSTTDDEGWGEREERRGDSAEEDEEEEEEEMDWVPRTVTRDWFESRSPYACEQHGVAAARLTVALDDLLVAPEVVTASSWRQAPQEPSHWAQPSCPHSVAAPASAASCPAPWGWAPPPCDAQLLGGGAFDGAGDCAAHTGPWQWAWEPLQLQMQQQEPHLEQAPVFMQPTFADVAASFADSSSFMMAGAHSLDGCKATRDFGAGTTSPPEMSLPAAGASQVDGVLATAAAAATVDGDDRVHPGAVRCARGWSRGSLRPEAAPCGATAGAPAKAEVGHTTVMLKNLPNNYTRADLLGMIESEGFAGRFDFLYFPIDFRTRAALGYAFLNLCTPADAEDFKRRISGFSRWSLPSSKTCTVAWSFPHQGLEAHIARYRNSPLFHESVPDAYRPVLFRDGARIPFPEPTKKIRPPRQGTERMLV